MDKVERFELPDSVKLLEKVFLENRDVYFSVLSLLANKGLMWCRDNGSEEFRTLTPYVNKWNRFYKLADNEKKAALALSKSIADSVDGRILFQYISILEEEMAKYDVDDEASFNQAAMNAIQVIENRKKGHGELFPDDEEKREFWSVILQFHPEAIEDDVWIPGQELQFYRNRYDMEHGILYSCKKINQRFIVESVNE